MNTIKKLLLVFLSCTGYAQAQPTLQYVQPPMIFTTEDLFNIQLGSPDTAYKYYQLTAAVSEQTRGVLAEVRTIAFEIPLGGLSIHAGNRADFGPFSTTWQSPAFLNELHHNSGFFPAGRYNVNFILSGTTANDPYSGTYTILNSIGYYQSVDFIQPLFLIYVFDADTIDQKNPVFSWTPVQTTLQAGDGSGEPITYLIEIAELLPGQTPYTAITSNPAYFTRNNLSVSYLQYPYDAREFSDSGTYAWRVHAYRQNSLLISSEIWTFSFAKKVRRKTGEYAWLKREIDQGYYVPEKGTVSFAYTEEYDVEEGAVLEGYLLNEEGAYHLNLAHLQLPVEKGVNKYTVPVSAEGLNLSAGNYMLVVRNGKGENWFLNIDNSNNNCCE